MVDTPPPAMRTSRLTRIVLVLSLALNLAVIGVVLGAAGAGRFGDGPPRSFDLGLGPIARALEPRERRAIARELRADRALRGLDPRGRLNDLAAALQADPFDPDVLRVLLAAQSRQIATVQAQAQDRLVDQITAMTPDRRRAFSERLLQEMSRGRASGR